MRKNFWALISVCALIAVATACTPIDSSTSNSVEDSSTSSAPIIEEHVHDWDAPTYSWSGSQCTAERECLGADCEEKETETVPATFVSDTAAGCTTDEMGHYEATFDNEAFTQQATEANSYVVEGTAGHTPAEAVVENRQNVVKCAVCEEVISQEYTYTTYENDSIVGLKDGMYFENAITMEELTGKALHFEFKLEGDGSFGFVIMAKDWANVTGKLNVTKKGEKVESNIGRIVALDDGWYAWELNQDKFKGDGAHRAADVGLIYHENIKVVGTLYIDWTSYKVVDAYDATRETEASKYMDGDIVGLKDGLYFDNPITMDELRGNALHLEFKLDGDGSFGFVVMAKDWANVTCKVYINKIGESVTANMGRIIALEDGWYAWELNQVKFAGDGAYRAANVGLIWHENIKVVGTLYIDWASYKAVDAYDKYTEGNIVGLENGYYFDNPIKMEALTGNALHFEFRIEGDGSFGFVIMAKDWANITGKLNITKTGDVVESNIGTIKDLNNGWYAWEINQEHFAGDGAYRATDVGLIWHDNIKVVGTVYVDWASFQVVAASTSRESKATKYAAGTIVGLENGLYFDNPITMAELEGKALRFEFKLEGDGSFGFTIMAKDWANVTGILNISKSGDTVTANKGRIIALEDGWYAWELNRADFEGDGAYRAADVGLIWHENIKVVGTLYIDWASYQVVDAK